MRVACMQVALHAPIAGMAGLALGLDFSKKLLQYATTALWHTAKVPVALYYTQLLVFTMIARHKQAEPSEAVLDTWNMKTNTLGKTSHNSNI